MPPFRARKTNATCADAAVTSRISNRTVCAMLRSSVVHSRMHASATSEFRRTYEAKSSSQRTSTASAPFGPSPRCPVSRYRNSPSLRSIRCVMLVKSSRCALRPHAPKPKTSRRWWILITKSYRPITICSRRAALMPLLFMRTGARIHSSKASSMSATSKRSPRKRRSRSSANSAPPGNVWRRSKGAASSRNGIRGLSN